MFTFAIMWPQPKPTPRVIRKILNRRAVAKLDRQAKEAVRVRDKESCRVCGRKSREVHERVMKSRGGVASLENSMVACRTCHQLLHAHGIRIYGGSCNEILEFGMSAQAAMLVFGQKAPPAHVTVE